MTIPGSKIDSSAPAVAGMAPAERIAAPVERKQVVEPAAPAFTVPQTEAKVLSQEQMRAVVAARLDQFMKESGRSVDFRVDHDAHATVITVRRADTGEVVRQFPTEEALALLRRLNEQSGTFLDLIA